MCNRKTALKILVAIYLLLKNKDPLSVHQLIVANSMYVWWFQLTDHEGGDCD